MASAVIEFVNVNKAEKKELEVPLSITANDLIEALNEAFQLGLDRENYTDYYLSLDNPIAFFRGERSLESFGVRNGSVLFFKR